MEENKKEEVKAVAKTSDSNILAALSYISIVSIVMYVIKKDDAYVMFHAKQGMVIFALSIIGTFTIPLFGLGFLINLLTLVLVIVGAIKAYQGEKYKFPVISDLAEKINF